MPWRPREGPSRFPSARRPTVGSTRVRFERAAGTVARREGEAAVVQDVVLAASALRVGVVPDLPGLIEEVWGAACLTEEVVWAHRLVRSLRPDA